MSFLRRDPKESGEGWDSVPDHNTSDLRDWTAVWAQEVRLGDRVGVLHGAHMHVGQIVRRDEEEQYSYGGSSYNVIHAILEDKEGMQQHFHWHPYEGLYISITSSLPTLETGANNPRPQGSE